MEIKRTGTDLLKMILKVICVSKMIFFSHYVKLNTKGENIDIYVCVYIDKLREGDKEREKDRRELGIEDR